MVFRNSPSLTILILHKYGVVTFIAHCHDLFCCFCNCQHCHKVRVCVGGYVLPCCVMQVVAEHIKTCGTEAQLVGLHEEEAKLSNMPAYVPACDYTAAHFQAHRTEMKVGVRVTRHQRAQLESERCANKGVMERF